MARVKSRSYVNRPSQITKGPPSRRLKRRRKRNVKAPKRGFFPNPRPLLYKICIQKGKGPKMHFDGQKFSQRARVTLLPKDRAITKARGLMKQFPVLRPYRMTVESNF